MQFQCPVSAVRSAVRFKTVSNAVTCHVTVIVQRTKNVSELYFRSHSSDRFYASRPIVDYPKYVQRVYCFYPISLSRVSDFSTHWWCLPRTVGVCSRSRSKSSGGKKKQKQKQFQKSFVSIALDDHDHDHD